MTDDPAGIAGGLYRWPDGFGRLDLAEIDSTNEEARRRAVEAEPGPLWIRADRQSAGRGRRGRAWVSPSGNLMATLLFRPRVSASVAAQVSFVAALAVDQVLTAWIDADRVRMKWPNDVLIDGAKISGILLESGSAADGSLDWLAVGIGLNLRHHPGDTPYAATDLAAEVSDHADVPAARHAFTHLAAAMAHWLAIWKEGQGFAAVRQAWLTRSRALGEPVRAHLGGRTMEGRFGGLDDEGHLLIIGENGETSTVAGGEVMFPGLLRQRAGPADTMEKR